MSSKFNIFNLDMYSKRTSFFFNNQEKIGSILGLFLTIVYMFASIGLFIFQIILAFQRKEFKVYDTTIHAQEMPNIDVNTTQFYFAFGLEEPNTSNRFIDNSIYIPKIVYVDKIKVNNEFITLNQMNLEYERCNVENFGKNYQHLFIKDELKNSFCLKKFNKNLTFAGGYKYERMTYIRIRIYPCVNSSDNNNSCKSQDEIDYYMSSGYFSIIIKDFGLNPSNYSFPVLPTLQDLYTTIDKRIYKNYILNFGITEIHTDTGLFSDNKKVKKYLQYRNELQTFTFRNEKEYYQGKSVILVQIKLDDTLLVQTRSYTKISDLLSRIGGYMQLINTAFLLLTSIINKFHCELKIINSIFNFNIKKNKVILSFKTLKDKNPNLISNARINRISFLSSKLSMENVKPFENDNKSKNNLIFRENDLSNFSSGFNIYGDKKNENHFIKINKNRNKNDNNYENIKLQFSKSRNGSFLNIRHSNNNIKNNCIHESHKKNHFDMTYKETNYLEDFNDHINMNLFDYFCLKNFSNKYKLFISGSFYYKKKMDIVHVFTLISVIENLLTNSNNDISSLYEEIELLNGMKK